MPMRDAALTKAEKDAAWPHRFNTDEKFRAPLLYKFSNPAGIVPANPEGGKSILTDEDWREIDESLDRQEAMLKNPPAR